MGYESGVGGGAGRQYDDRMKTYVAFFRGINVGGNNILPMKDLVGVLESIGSRNVKTYIQSGNAILQSEETEPSRLSDRISTAIEKSHGFKPRVLLLEIEEIEQAVASNPFLEAESEPKTLHLFFLAAVPDNPNLSALEDTKRDSERFVLEDNVLYLHAPDGIGRSRLAASAEKLVGVPATARNWNTICKVMEMARQSG